MSNPTQPNVLPAWTQGNNSVRQQPTDGEQLTGFTPNFRPPSGWHNWLFGILSDWIAWLNFITANPGYFPVSNAGHHVATAGNLQGQLDQLDAVMSTLGLVVIPTVQGNGTQVAFPLPQAPINANSAVPTLDGVECQESEYTVEQISGTWNVVFGTAPAAGQQVSGFILTGSSGVGVGGGVGAIENAPGGVGIFYQNDVNVAVLKSLIAGTNMTITDDADGNITLSSTGGGGGSIEVHGSASAPVSVVPGTGVVPTTAAEQVWWIQPSAGSGAVPITATPPIAAGTTVGQRLKLKSVAAANYLTIPNVSGVDMNGPINMGTYGQAIDYTWDGTNWSEDSRRV